MDKQIIRETMLSLERVRSRAPARNISIMSLARGSTEASRLKTTNKRRPR